MPAPATDESYFQLLFPRPQRLQRRPGVCALPAKVTLAAPADVLGSPAVGWLERALEARGHGLERAESARGRGVVRCEAFMPRWPSGAASTAHRQQHAIEIDGDAVVISCVSAATFQHALASLTQLIAFAPGAPGRVELPRLNLEDWPDFSERGAMLDISRNKVPTLDTLKGLIDQLARWKLNQLQLYIEHTFAYPGHDVVWQHASPLTAADVRELDAWCAARHIELVPNQNSFGHMHRWLVHEPYRALAECPDGFDHPWNWTKEPYGLCATDPHSLVFLEGLYDQLLPHFTSGKCNVGLDETLDLGACRSRAECEARGSERVYLEFLEQVHARVRARGKVMQFWGDIIVKRPDLIAELPRDAIALEWGYEADHPFAEHLALFKQAGLDFYVCPGTSSWNSIAGRTHNALDNLARAAREGKAAGASGLLITDWGDHGHLQPLAVSYLGLLAGAGFAWNTADAERPHALDVPALLDQHVFGDSAGVLGRAAYDLGNAYLHAGSLRPNASVLFWILIKPERLFSPAGVTRGSLERTLDYIQRAGAALGRAQPGTLRLVHTPREGAHVVEELGWARDLLAFACRLGIARSSLRDPSSLSALPASERAELGRELRELRERHQALWLERNREGGLADSSRRLDDLLVALDSGARPPRGARASR